MPSRKSPSQRDPMTRMRQSVRSVAPASMGGRVANAQPTQPAGAARDRRGLPLTRIEQSGAADGDVATWSDTANAWVPLPGGGGGGGDTTHPGSGVASTQVGASAVAGGNDTVALGVSAQANGLRGTALGEAAHANYTDSVAVGTAAVAGHAHAIAVGSGSSASGEGGVAVGFDASDSGYDDGVAVGYGAGVGGYDSVAVGALANALSSTGVAVGSHAYAAAGAVAIGYGANNTHSSTALIKGDDLEVEAASGITGSHLILTDTASGVRMRISVTSGVLSVAPA